MNRLLGQCNGLMIYNKIEQVLVITKQIFNLGVDRLSAPILSILPIIDIGHFKNRFADIFFFFFFMQTNTIYR